MKTSRVAILIAAAVPLIILPQNTRAQTARGPESKTIRLEPQDNSRVSGKAVLVANGPNQTLVVISLDGPENIVVYSAAIRYGVCSDLKGVSLALKDVREGGTSVTSIPASFFALTVNGGANRQYALSVNQNPNVTVACGEWGVGSQTTTRNPGSDVPREQQGGLITCYYDANKKFTGSDAANPGVSKGGPIHSGAGDYTWAYTIPAPDGTTCPRPDMPALPGKKPTK